MIILIPAYEPDGRLLTLVESILEHCTTQVVVVDDGSGPDHEAIFAGVRALGCDVVTHPVNRGKGAALKTGFDHIERSYPGQDVVCADCDGQHSVRDIKRVAAELAWHRDGIVLGARQFTGQVPLRSRIGNDVTRLVFRVATGLRLTDTQTGLRGYPAARLGWLRSLAGERFEYELQVLLAARQAGVPLHEVAIETIYLAENESSHFDPIRDSIRVYVPFVKFCAASLAAFALDIVLFFALVATTGSLATAVIGARLVSATVNFTTNRRVVFAAQRGRASSAWRYAALVVALMGTNYALIRALVATGFPLLGAKATTELSLFLLSYNVQRRFVFANAKPDAAAPAPQRVHDSQAHPAKQMERLQ